MLLLLGWDITALSPVGTDLGTQVCVFKRNKSVSSLMNEYNYNSMNLIKAHKATPIYSLVLRAQEVENEPFWNKKKS